jgi:hypothetical protein
MMIDIGETEVFEGKMAQMLDGVVRRELALFDLLEEFADRVGVHAS